MKTSIKSWVKIIGDLYLFVENIFKLVIVKR